jgi:hypothetical protein
MYGKRTEGRTTTKSGRRKREGEERWLNKNKARKKE